MDADAENKMAQVINEKRALASLDRYFGILSERGYVKNSTVSRFLLYLFLIDFTECVFPFLTDEDYQKIRNLLARIFSGGDCLLPYPYGCDKELKLGMPYPFTKSLGNVNDSNLSETEEELRRI